MRVGIIAVAIILGSSPAIAADNWHGFYSGVIGSYAVGSFHVDGDGRVYDGLDGPGVGVTAIWHQPMGGYVLSLGADAMWLHERVDIGPPQHFQTNWRADLSGSIGYDAGTVMPFVSAGLGVAGAEFEILPAIGSPYEMAHSVHATAFAGAGAEFALTQNMHVRAEYRYTHLFSAPYRWSTIGPFNYSTDSHSVLVSALVGFR